MNPLLRATPEPGNQLATGQWMREVAGIITRLSFPTWFKFAVRAADMSAGATSRTIEVAKLPPGMVLHAVKLKHSAAFAGGLISAYTIEVGDAATTNLYLPAFDVFQAVSPTAYALAGMTLGGSQTASSSLRVTARSTGANTSAATAGQAELWAMLSVAT